MKSGYDAVDLIVAVVKHFFFQDAGPRLKVLRGGRNGGLDGRLDDGRLVSNGRSGSRLFV